MAAEGHRTPWNVLKGFGVASIEITGPFSGYLSSQLAITESTRLVGRTQSAHVKSRVRPLDGPEGTGDWDPAEVYPGNPGYLETTYEATASSLISQEPWVFNWGIHDFTEGERERIRRAIEKIKGERCRTWLEETIRALGRPDLSVESTRPKTLDRLLEYAEFNKYDPQLTATEMRISQDRRNKIADRYENRWTNLNIANAVTLAPDFTRIYLMPSAFWQDSTLFPYSGRDLSGIIAFELLHVAGFGDGVLWKHREALQRHCGDPSDLL